MIWSDSFFTSLVNLTDYQFSRQITGCFHVLVFRLGYPALSPCNLPGCVVLSVLRCVCSERAAGGRWQPDERLGPALEARRRRRHQHKVGETRREAGETGRRQGRKGRHEQEHIAATAGRASSISLYLYRCRILNVWSGRWKGLNQWLLDTHALKWRVFVRHFLVLWLQRLWW